MGAEDRAASTVRTVVMSVVLAAALVLWLPMAELPVLPGGPPRLIGARVALLAALAGLGLVLAAFDGWAATRRSGARAGVRRFRLDALPLLLAAVTIVASYLTPQPLVLVPLLVVTITVAALALEDGAAVATVVFAAVLTAVVTGGLAPGFSSLAAVLYVAVVEPLGLLPVATMTAGAVVLLVLARRTNEPAARPDGDARLTVVVRMAAVGLIVLAVVTAVEYTGRAAANTSVRSYERTLGSERAKLDEKFVEDLGRYFDQEKAYDKTPSFELVQAIWQRWPELDSKDGESMASASNWALFAAPQGKTASDGKYGFSDYVFLGGVRTWIDAYWPQDHGAVAGEPQASHRGTASRLSDFDAQDRATIATVLGSKRDGLKYEHAPLKDGRSFELGLFYPRRTEYFYEYPGGGSGVSGEAKERPRFIIVLLPKTKPTARMLREETPRDSNLGMSRFISTTAVGLLMLGCGLGLAVAVRRDMTRLEAMQAEERARIQREAHDRIANRLSALALQAEAASSAQAEASDIVRSLPGALRRSVSDLREIVSGDGGGAEGLTARLEQVCRERAADHVLDLDCVIDLGPGAVLTAAAEESVVSMLQEALGNVAKHAEARHVRVRAHRMEGKRARYEMTVADDGRGFVPPEDLRTLEAQGHTGLAGIERRARTLGGGVEVDSAPGQGTTVRITWETRGG